MSISFALFIAYSVFLLIILLYNFESATHLSYKIKEIKDVIIDTIESGK